MNPRRITRDDTDTGRVYRASVENSPASRSQVHPWRVLHASDVTAPLADLISGQHEVGMRPEVLTRQGSVRSSDLSILPFRKHSNPNPTSLIDLWRHSRSWERLIRNSERGEGFEIVHAHNLSSAFAAAKQSTAIVYDIEQYSSKVFFFGANLTMSERRWFTSRALRSAEQFVLNRAITVCHRRSVRDELMSRDMDGDTIFVVPEAFYVSPAPLADVVWLQTRNIDSRRSTVLFAPAWTLSLDRQTELAPASRTLLEVFAVVASECEDAQFLAECAPEAESAVAEWSAALGIKSRLHLVAERERHLAEVSSDIIIGSDLAFTGPKSALNPFSLRALLHRKALLAADVESNRDLTPEGRGCLWYAHKSPRDLARRAAFLARTPDFRQTLANSGYNYVRESRDPISVAAKYDAIYRLAFSRQARGRSAPPVAQLAPAI